MSDTNVTKVWLLNRQGDNTRVMRIDDANTPLVTHYILPSDTLEPETSVTCKTQAEAVDASNWVAGMMNTGLADEIKVFSSPQTNGRKLDTITVVFKTPEAKTRRALIETPMMSFAGYVNNDGTMKNPRMALLNLKHSVSDEELQRRVMVFINKGDDQDKAIIKTILGLFNERVAGPDNGEVLFDSFDVKTGELKIGFKGQCASGCNGVEFSKTKIEKLFEFYRMGDAVRRITARLVV